MAVIGSIRKRGGLIAVVIFVALLAFVLGDFLFKGRGLFQSEQNAGKIAGNAVSLIEFDNEFQMTSDRLKERRQQTTLDEETTNKVRDQVWEKFVNELAVEPQFEKAGITVSDAEVKALTLGNDPDPMVTQYFSDQNGQLFPFFRDPSTGRLNPRSVKTYVDSLRDSRWIEFEDMLRQTRMQTKYTSLVKMGLYVTTAQAKADYANLNRSVNFKYIIKSYNSVPDSSVKITDQDMLKYYNENRYKYKQDASRKLEYVIFDIKPTQTDFDEVKSDMQKVEADWKEIKSKKDDSLIVVRESDTRKFDTTHYAQGMLPVSAHIDSVAQNAEDGTLLPLSLNKNTYMLCKVMDHIMVPDSAKARHILIKVAEKDSLGKIKAKIKIDSIKTVIEKKHNFGEMAKLFSDDPGSKDSSGNVGWFTAGKMVSEFQNACFDGKKGDLVVVHSQFGYHLIEILDQTPRLKKTQLAVVARKVEPGTKTRQDVYNSAVDFLTKYHTTETFEKGVEEAHVIKYKADPLKENDKAIAGIDNPREIIRWAFNAKQGDVTTEPFSFADKYVVAHLAEIREEGIAPMDQKKEDVEAGARKAKKAEKFIQEMNALNAQTIDDYASKMNLHVNSSEGTTFTSFSIPNIGREMNLYGTLFTLKQNETSKPLAGEMGVYVLKIDKITEPPAVTNYAQAKMQAERNYQYRADMEAIEAIKKKADIKDMRYKYF